MLVIVKVHFVVTLFLSLSIFDDLLEIIWLFFWLLTLHSHFCRILNFLFFYLRISNCLYLILSLFLLFSLFHLSQPLQSSRNARLARIRCDRSHILFSLDPFSLLNAYTLRGFSILNQLLLVLELLLLAQDEVSDFVLFLLFYLRIVLLHKSL